MAVVLSHQSALDVTRELRAEGVNMHELETTSLVRPSAWVGTRLNMRNFDPAVWRWQQPGRECPLHILVPSGRDRLRGKYMVSHPKWRDVPGSSFLWLDENSSVVCPELLFLQAASFLSLPALVMLGLELCGHFSRDVREPLGGVVSDGVPAATSVADLSAYLAQFSKVPGLVNARMAIDYICDHAISAPEAVLATMYALPTAEGGYGFGRVRLNERVSVSGHGTRKRAKHRYPDLMFGFAPVGLNYDGSKHFDVPALISAAEALASAGTGASDKARDELKRALTEARAKILDDNQRNRQLAAQGRIVFSITKEDIADGRHLDALTRQVLDCANSVFGVDTSDFARELNNTSMTRDRWDLLNSLLPGRRSGGTSYGKL